MVLNSPQGKRICRTQVIGGDEFDISKVQVTYINHENSEFSVKLPLEDDKIFIIAGPENLGTS